MSVDRNEYREMLKSKSIEEIFEEELCPAFDWDDRDSMYYCIVELARRFDVPLKKWTGEEE